MYERILVPVDGSATSDRGLEEAIRLAKLTGGRLRLLHVVDLLSFELAAEGWGGPSPELIALLKEGGQDVLRKARATVAAAGVPVDTVLLENLSGRVSELVVEHAAQWEAALIAVGTHGRRGAGPLMIGGNAEQIVHMATVPVLLVRTSATAPATHGGD